MIAPRPERRRSGRAGTAGPLVFVVGIVVLVVALLVAAKPVLVSVVTDVAEERPGLLKNESVRDLVRSELGEAAERAADPGAQSTTFLVGKGDTAVAVAHRLAEAKVISRPIVFLLPLFEAGKEESLQAGTYRVSAAMRPADLSQLFQRGYGEQLVLRVIDGWRLTEIAAEVQARFPTVSGDAFTKAAVAGNYRYDFLAEVKAGTPLEGFLFPDTYFFSADATAEDVVRTLLDTFQRRSGAVVMAAAQKRKVKVYDIVTIASIVEREARDRKEAPTIASVYWNRIDRGMALDADPTIQYALGAWRELMLADLKVDSPYNTYLNPGLPPTPICAPGADALAGAADPATTEYLFFVAKNDGTGDHAFARTIEEHEANRVKYGNK